MLENPLDIHLSHTEHYRSALAISLQHRGGIHAEGPEGWNWESGGTKEEFLVARHHHHIPAKYQNVIWEATQPPLQADEVRDELVVSFDVPPLIS